MILSIFFQVSEDRLCISKLNVNDKSELSLDWVVFIIVEMRNFSRDIARQEILCRIVSND